MSQPTLTSVPPLGALCVAAGLVSQDDLDACLTLQRQTDDGTPIGQILLLHNYLSARDLARMVKHQEHVRRMHYAMANESFAPTDGASTHAALTPSLVSWPVLTKLGLFTAAELDAQPLFGATR